jgi:biotin synthase-like enzyme
MTLGDRIRQMNDEELINFLKLVEVKTIRLNEACACCTYNYNHEYCMMFCLEGRKKYLEREEEVPTCESNNTQT